MGRAFAFLALWCVVWRYTVHTAHILVKDRFKVPVVLVIFVAQK